VEFQFEISTFNDGRTEFASCTCRTSTFEMAVQGSQALCLPRFNFLDGGVLKCRASRKNELNGLPVYSGIDVSKLYMNTGLQLMPLSASSHYIYRFADQ